MFINKFKFWPCFIFSFCSLILLPTSSFSQYHHDWSYNLSIYEVNVRQFTQEGTFAAFETHLERLKEMGVGILWFMPINPIGVQKRIGSLGSYYSVKDYMDVNSEFGTLDDFKSLVQKAHDMGFYVIIDWVANHTAWDNPLTISHPDWYSKDANGNFIAPPGTNWTDVIDLNYSKQELRNYMIDAMKFWITETDIDGFRCDAAIMVPLDFWTTANRELKTIKPKILMLAEADGVAFKNAGFDMTFAWGLYGFGSGVFPKIIQGTYNANYLASYLSDELYFYSDNHYRMYFTSNHDENSWYGTVFERFGAAAETFAVITLTMNSVPLIYGGQEAGLDKRLQFFDKDQIVWKTHPFSTVYTNLLKLKRENKALWNGKMGGDAKRVRTNNNNDIFSFVRQKDDDKIFAIFNLTNKEQNVIPQGDLFAGSYINISTNDTVIYTLGSEITLSPWDYKILKSVPGITKVENSSISDINFTLKQNYPNPFNPSTVIEYSIPSDVKSEMSNVKLFVYDILGREVAALVNQEQQSGNYKIEFDAPALPSGIYFYQLQYGSFFETKKLVLLR